MRTWGPGLFENDLAAQLRTEFNATLAQGHSVFVACQQLKTKYTDSDSAIVNITLAALQLEHDVIDPKIRKRALTAIVLGEAVERWNGDAAQLDAHKQALDQLRIRLNAMG